jgi:Cysteine dioxygenase type I
MRLQPASRIPALTPQRYDGVSLDTGPGLGLSPGSGPAQTLTPAELGRLVVMIAGAREAWQPIVRFGADQRWFRRLELTPDYEVWLLSWLPGQRTGFHDHGIARGAFAVAHGRLRETLARPGRTGLRHRTARQGSVTRFGGLHLHDVGNVAAAPAVSVHAYSPPLSAMRRYEMTSAGLALVGTDVAEQDW